MVVSVNFEGTIYSNFPNPSENAGRILKISASSLPRIFAGISNYNNIGLTKTVRFENCPECPTLFKLRRTESYNVIGEENTCITLQSDGAYDVIDGDLTIVVDVKNDFRGFIRINLSPARDNPLHGRYK